MDVVDFSVYWDTETIGEMEGDNLVVSEGSMNSVAIFI